MPDAAGQAVTRHALIIVVPECRNDSGLDLPIVRNDADALARSLRQSDYVVTSVGAEAAHDVSKSLIRTHIRKALEAVPAGGTLLVFLSGHGIFLKGTSYLVPYDADFSDNDPEETLFAIPDVLRSADQSRAQQIVVFVDTCQEGVTKSVKAAVLKRMGADAEHYLAKREIAFIFSCHPGELSHYVPGENGFSIFSKAVATALAADHPAETLAEVIAAADKIALTLSKQHNRPKQKINFIVNQSSEMAQTVICEGGAASSQDLREMSWAEAARKSQLWGKTTAKEAGNSPFSVAVRGHVERLVGCAYETFLAAEVALSDDPWRDERYPVRVLQQIEKLVKDCGFADLTSSEVALLIASPFIREHAYAGAAEAFAGARPKEPDIDVDAVAPAYADYRRRLLTTYRIHPQAMRRVASLRSGGGKKPSEKDEADARIILYWLLHRQLARYAAMWQPPSLGTFKTMPTALDVESSFAGEIERIFVQSRLIKLAKCVRCEPMRLANQAGTDQADDAIDDLAHDLEDAVLPGRGDEPIRERLLAALLCVAGWLALDPRLADVALIDHIGIADEVDIRSFHASISMAAWQPTWGGAWRLETTCDHPAVDYALREIVLGADRVIRELVQVLHRNDSVGKLVAALPGRFSLDGIVPGKLPDGPAYTLPHKNFTLAHHEVRELLMGEQLYGNPDLAIRELYQNALDACRYRQARVDYLARRGRPHPWTGRIVFRQGTENGRAFIECEDNGVGMGSHELDACFSRAGKRFADLPEFIEEQELWNQCEPKVEFWPNSQFGIGVLSYFMIADEIEVSTRRFLKDGQLGPRQEISIPGSGNLFRVRLGQPVGDAGTRVRLFLRDDWKKSSCDVLDSLLVIADFETIVQHGARTIKWNAGVPRNKVRYTATDNPDFWWDSEINNGMALADGLIVDVIKTKIWDGRHDIAPWSDSYSNFYNEFKEFSGVLVNFKGKNRPKLTIDRSRALQIDENWLLDVMCSQIKYLPNCNWLRFTWLWRLPGRVVPVLFENFANLKLYIPIGYRNELFDKRGGINIQFDFDRTVGSNIAFPLNVIGINFKHANSIKLLINSLYCIDDKEKISNLNSFVKFERGKRYEFDDNEIMRNMESLSYWKENVRKFDHEISSAASVFAKLGVPHGKWIIEFLPNVNLEERSKILANPLRRRSKISSIIYVLGLKFEYFSKKIPERIRITVSVVSMFAVVVFVSHFVYVLGEKFFKFVVKLFMGSI